MLPNAPGIFVRALFFFVIPISALVILVSLLGNHLIVSKGMLVDENKLTTREAGGITVGYSSDNALDQKRLDYLNFLIQNAPKPFLDDKPKAVYFISSQEIQNSVLSHYFSKPGGATIGNTIYLVEGSRYKGEEFVKNYFLAHIFFHEWTHVVQYQKILKEETLLGSALKLVNISDKTNFPGKFIVDYALKAGWEPILHFPIEVYLLPNAKVSHLEDDYGATSIVESQATVAGYVMSGNAAVMSDLRVKWVEDFTGKSSEDYFNDLVSYTYTRKD